MDVKKELKKYRARLARESFLKSFLCGLGVGFAALLVCAAVFWFTELKGWWICMLVWAGTTALATVIFYYARFRTSIKETAKRVDAVGLEERLLTMIELEDDSSFIAVKQREDALSALQTVNKKLIRFAISVPIIAFCAVTAFFGMGMSTVNALSEAGILPSGKKVAEEIVQPAPKEFALKYKVEQYIERQEDGKSEKKDCGSIQGEKEQTVTEGNDGSAIMVVAEPGWAFIGWSDGVDLPYRQDLNVSKNLEVTAKFEKIEDRWDDPLGDDATDQPHDEEKQENPSNNGEGGEDGSGGKYSPNNQVIDGKTYYGDKVFENAYEQAMENISQNEGMSEGKKDFIEDYLDTIAK